ncbi:MAG: trypsin-like serine peptidase [Bacteroidales bacterium]|jgi:hypothetical protein
MKKYFLFFCFIALSLSVKAQICHGEYPISFYYNNIFNEKDISTTEVKIDMDYINNSKETNSNGCLYHIGTFIEQRYKSNEVGRWINIDNYDIYIAKFRVGEAHGTSISFSEINIPENGKLFIYDATKQVILGYYDCNNILEDGSFSFEPLYGNVIYLEYYSEKSSVSKDFYFTIDGFSYFFESNFFNTKQTLNFGDSGDCHVNINCPEGNSLHDISNAVVKILVLGSNNYYVCTGTLMNNTKEDRTPYLLTAWHCSQNTRPAEYKKWVFYFNYESTSCETPNTEPEHKTLVGCIPIATSEKYGFIQNSDFYLFKLINDVIPEDYNPYFAGWDATGTKINSANSIHHPKGDIKKISKAYNITESAWEDGSTKKTHLKVNWQQTQSGWGVTEGGSSGAPLINSKGYVIGTLSGGNSSCDNLNGFDKFGKLSFPWDGIGNDSTSRLDYWLDPRNTGLKEFNGYSDILNVRLATYLDNPSDYNYNNPTIVVGDALSFKPEYTTYPDSCKWTFYGGSPETSKDIEPKNIVYNSYGAFDVNLILYKSGHTPKEIKFDKFVNVVPQMYPVPFEEKITVILSNNLNENTDANVFKYFRLISTNGKESYLPNNVEFLYNKIVLYFYNITKGVYVLQLISDTDKINLLISK